MKTLFAAAIALTTLASAATAQMASHDAMAKDAMATDAMAKMPAADRKKVGQCKAMAPAMMAKSAMCAKMMKMYPDNFNGSDSKS